MKPRNGSFISGGLGDVFVRLSRCCARPLGPDRGAQRCTSGRGRELPRRMQQRQPQRLRSDAEAGAVPAEIRKVITFVCEGYRQILNHFIESSAIFQVVFLIDIITWKTGTKKGPSCSRKTGFLLSL